MQDPLKGLFHSPFQSPLFFFFSSSFQPPAAPIPVSTAPLRNSHVVLLRATRVRDPCKAQSANRNNSFGHYRGAFLFCFSKKRIKKGASRHQFRRLAWRCRGGVLFAREGEGVGLIEDSSRVATAAHVRNEGWEGVVGACAFPKQISKKGPERFFPGFRCPVFFFLSASLLCWGQKCVYYGFHQVPMMGLLREKYSCSMYLPRRGVLEHVSMIGEGERAKVLEMKKGTNPQA